MKEGEGREADHDEHALDKGEEEGHLKVKEDHGSSEEEVNVEDDLEDGEEGSQYGEESSSEASDDYDSDEVVDEAELSDEEAEDDDYDEEDVEDERPKKRGRKPKYPRPPIPSYHPGMPAPSSFYPAGPIMPPLIAATIPMFAKAFGAGVRPPSAPMRGSESVGQAATGTALATDQVGENQAKAAQASTGLTAAQLQEITRATVSHMANMSSALSTSSAGPRLPLLLPRNPEVTSQIRANVSAELKQNLTTMLMNPVYRQALLMQLAATQSPQQQQQQQFVFRQYRPSGRPPGRPQGSTSKKGKSLAVRGLDGDESTGEDDGTIASRRPRRTPSKSVSYSQYFEEDEQEEEEEEEEATKRKQPIKTTPTVAKRKVGRPRKSAIVEEETTEDEEKHLYEQQEEASSEGPSIDKILSKRVTKEGSEEYLVKWTGKSYLHVEWITRDELVECTRNAATRLTRFNSKPLEQHHYSKEHIFNPAFTLPERIMYGWEHPGFDDPAKMQSSFLVKWTGIPCEDATWEIEPDVVKASGGAGLVAVWKTQQTAEEKLRACLPPGQRPDPSTHKALVESAVYRNENTLRPYQLEGLNWLLYCWLHRQSCIIADEMGLGKTVQSVAFLDYLHEHFSVPGPFLVVAPLSTLPHWEREFERWSSALRVITYHGSVAGREVQAEYEFFYKSKDGLGEHVVSNVCRFDVLITTYEMALAGEAHLSPINWRVAIFDEAHRLKNKASKAAETLKLLSIEHKLLLTGTPLQNNIEELWALLNFLQPQRFHSEEAFRVEYGQLKRSEDVQRLQELLRPLMLRRLKEDVEKSIPVKEETIVEVELTSTQKRYYRAILERNFAFLMQGASAKNAPSLLNTMMELRKCCIHPYLISGAEQRILSERGHAQHASQEELFATMIQASGKLVLLDKLLARLREGGHRVLIFSQMTRCLDILGDYLRHRHYPFERIDGSIRGDERQAAIDRFCNLDTDAFVFLLCTRAGGVGINLTAADTVIIYDSDWNPQNDLQAQARCHRIGQTKSVKIYRLLTRNTYEREMFDRAGLKLGLDKAVLGQKMADLESAMQREGPSSLAPSALDRREVELLLKKGAYGLLMEDDEAAVQFCEESIDQILERRTTVIRHGDKGGTARPSSSIFSKASFAATTADDDGPAADIDIDDPNFWERWAKKMRVDPGQLLDATGGRGMALLDEPRIKRQVRRIRNDADNLGLSEVFSVATGDNVTTGKNSGEWTDEERVRLLQNILDLGLSNVDLSRHPGRSRNDLLAAARHLLRECLDRCAPAILFSGSNTPAAHDEARFKEDFEKLVIGRIEFDVLNPEDTPEKNRPAVREFARSEIPYPYASRPQILAYKSFCAWDEDLTLARLLEAHGRTIVLRVQLYELIRQFGIVDSASIAQLVPGAGLRDWWTREHDAVLLHGIVQHGLRAYSCILKDEPFCKQPVEDLPSPEELDERVLKLLSAFERRSRATAKAALHTIHEQRKRTPTFKPTPRKSVARRKRRIASEEEEEEEESELDEYVEKVDVDDVLDELMDDDDEEQLGTKRKPRGKEDRVYKGSTARRQKSTPVSVVRTRPSESVIARWSRRDRNDFMRVVGQFGIPPPRRQESTLTDDPLNESPVERDWETFRRISDFATPRSDAQLDEFAPVFVAMCKASAAANTVVRDMAGDEEVAVIPADRARRSLQRIATFSRLRSWLVDPSLNLDDIVSVTRRTGGLPRWWIPGPHHDMALLHGIARYGTAQIPWIIGDRELAFWPIYEAAVPTLTTVSAEVIAGPNTRRRSKPPLPTAEDAIKPSAISWPNEMVTLRRFDLLVDLIERELRKREEQQPLTLKLSRS